MAVNRRILSPLRLPIPPRGLEAKSLAERPQNARRSTAGTHQMSSGALRPRNSNCGNCRTGIGSGSHPPPAAPSELQRRGHGTGEQHLSGARAAAKSRGDIDGITDQCGLLASRRAERPQGHLAQMQPNPDRGIDRKLAPPTCGDPRRSPGAWHGPRVALRARRCAPDRRHRNPPSCRRLPYGTRGLHAWPLRRQARQRTHPAAVRCWPAPAARQSRCSPVNPQIAPWLEPSSPRVHGRRA